MNTTKYGTSRYRLLSVVLCATMCTAGVAVANTIIYITPNTIAVPDAPGWLDPNNAKTEGPGNTTCAELTTSSSDWADRLQATSWVDWTQTGGGIIQVQARIKAYKYYNTYTQTGTLTAYNTGSSGENISQSIPQNGRNPAWCCLMTLTPPGGSWDKTEVNNIDLSFKIGAQTSGDDWLEFDVFQLIVTTPEPSTVAFLAFGLPLVLRRRSRRHQ